MLLSLTDAWADLNPITLIREVARFTFSFAPARGMSGGLPLVAAERPCERYRCVLSVCVSVCESVTEIEILLSEKIRFTAIGVGWGCNHHHAILVRRKNLKKIPTQILGFRDAILLMTPTSSDEEGPSTSAFAPGSQAKVGNVALRPMVRLSLFGEPW